MKARVIVAVMLLAPLFAAVYRRENPQEIARFERLRADLEPLPSRYDVYVPATWYTSMRSNIVIDDKLMKAALRATGLKTKREVVELALRTLLRLREQEGIRQLRGKVVWEGDLDAMRTDRGPG
jgi:Arc/MetJ family transcription regulator